MADQPQPKNRPASKIQNAPSSIPRASIRLGVRVFAAFADNPFTSLVGTGTYGTQGQTSMRYGIVLASLPGGSGTHRTARQHSCVACKAGAAATQVDGCGRTRKSITGSRYFGSGVTIGTKGGRGCSARPRDEDGTEDKDIHHLPKWADTPVHRTESTARQQSAKLLVSHHHCLRYRPAARRRGGQARLHGHAAGVVSPAMNLPALRSRFASGVTSIPGRLLFGLRRAFTFCAFGLGALGLNRSVAFGLLRPFGLTGFLFRPRSRGKS